MSGRGLLQAGGRGESVGEHVTQELLGDTAWVSGHSVLAGCLVSVFLFVPHAVAAHTVRSAGALGADKVNSAPTMKIWVCRARRERFVHELVVAGLADMSVVYVQVWVYDVRYRELRSKGRRTL